MVPKPLKHIYKAGWKGLELQIRELLECCIQSRTGNSDWSQETGTWIEMWNVKVRLKRFQFKTWTALAGGQESPVNYALQKNFLHFAYVLRLSRRQVLKTMD